MSSTKAEIDLSYSVSNDFFELWLDENMHYTSASYLTGNETFEEAQWNKCKILYDYAEMTPEKLVLDIGCGWGSNLAYHAMRGTKRAHGITLSTAQAEYATAKNHAGVTVKMQDFWLYEPEEKYDALQSIEMVDHVVSPQQANEGKASPSPAPTSASRPSFATASHAAKRTWRISSSPPTSSSRAASTRASKSSSWQCAPTGRSKSFACSARATAARPPSGFASFVFTRRRSAASGATKCSSTTSATSIRACARSRPSGRAMCR